MQKTIEKEKKIKYSAMQMIGIGEKKDGKWKVKMIRRSIHVKYK